MNRQQFLSLSNSNSDFDRVQMEGLDTIVKKYPYFQTARAIQLKGFYHNQSFFYQPALKKTAAYTTDRSVLFEYLVTEEFNQIKVANQIKNRELNAQKDEVDLNKTLQINRSEADQVLDPDLFKKMETVPKGIAVERVSKLENKDKVDKRKQGEVVKIDNEKSEAKQVETFDVDENQTKSFLEWLKITSSSENASTLEKKETGENFSLEKNDFKRRREQKIIDKFIKNNPKIKPSSERLSSSFLPENSGNETTLMTETLAKIYADQKKYDKAIQAYKILILKNPEKSGLFADRIQEIENNKENKN